MTAETFFAVRNELYQRFGEEPTYYCLICDRELNCGHAPDCHVGWFEETFYEPPNKEEAS